MTEKSKKVRQVTTNEGLLEEGNETEVLEVNGDLADVVIETPVIDSDRDVADESRQQENETASGLEGDLISIPQYDANDIVIGWVQVPRTDANTSFPEKGNGILTAQAPHVPQNKREYHG